MLFPLQDPMEYHRTPNTGVDLTVHGHPGGEYSDSALGSTLDFHNVSGKYSRLHLSKRIFQQDRVKPCLYGKKTS
jgi:hypothetical protein